MKKIFNEIDGIGYFSLGFFITMIVISIYNISITNTLDKWAHIGFCGLILLSILVIFIVFDEADNRLKEKIIKEYHSFRNAGQVTLTQTTQPDGTILNTVTSVNEPVVEIEQQPNFTLDEIEKGLSILFDDVIVNRTRSDYKRFNYEANVNYLGIDLVVNDEVHCACGADSLVYHLENQLIREYKKIIKKQREQ